MTINTNDFVKLAGDKILIVDGAMGTELQKLGLSAGDYGDARHEGCNEYLCLKTPELVAKVHESYLLAGADIIETNTFGANPVVLAEYGLQGETAAINEAAVKIAKSAAAKHSADKPRFVAGSMGPTTKSVFVTGGISFDELKTAYYEQAFALIKAGADLLLVETAHDMMNIKAALEAAFEAKTRLKQDTPVIVSASMGQNGTLLSGQDAESFYVSLMHCPIAAIGFNCAAGPAEMADRLRTLAEISKIPAICMPNAGLPDADGKYILTPGEFAAKMKSYAAAGWLNIAGGCCGTTPEHIRALAAALSAQTPRKPAAAARWAVCGTETLFFDKIEPPVMAGERANSIGSRIFRELVAAGKWDEAVDVAKRQVKNGAQIIDVCLANPDRDEKADMRVFINKLARAVRVPLMFDTASGEVAQEAAALCPGKSVWNSVNLESGAQKLAKAAELNRRYGTKLVAGCIDETGMAGTAARKLEVAEKIHSALTGLGVPEEDIIFDALVFPAAAGDGKYSKAAGETVQGLKLIKAKFPGCKTILGVSNVSFGLPPEAREALNALFLHRCVQAGLDIAIVNTEKLKRYPSLTAEEKTLGEKLLFSPDAQTIAAFAALFRNKRPAAPETSAQSPADKLCAAIIEGTKDGVADAVAKLLAGSRPLEIVNGPIAKAMSEVGRLFAKGELIITEVLQSAETVKLAVATLEPHMQAGETTSRGKLLLATVKGDVHDIGKNLVAMIFQSNGFEVIDLGVKVPNEVIVQKAAELKPDIIGLSGLLTRSAEQMASVAEDLAAANLEIPIIAGGAALSERFVKTKIAPASKAGAHYAADAMRGLEIAAALIPKK